MYEAFSSLFVNKQETTIGPPQLQWRQIRRTHIMELRSLVKHTQLVLTSLKSVFNLPLGFILLSGSRFLFLSLPISFFCLFFHSRLFSFLISSLVWWIQFLSFSLPYYLLFSLFSFLVAKYCNIQMSFMCVSFYFRLILVFCFFLVCFILRSFSWSPSHGQCCESGFQYLLCFFCILLFTLFC